MAPFLLPGGEKMHIFFGLQNAKSRDWGIVWTSNLYRQTLWTHPALLGLCLVFFDVKIKTYARLIKVGEKCTFCRSSSLEYPMGCRMWKLLKTCQLRSNPLRNRFIALLYTSNRLFGQKAEKSGLVHFPLGFSCKKFQNFSKIFFAQNCIKRYLRYVGFPP